MYTFNEASFTTSIKEYQAAYDYSSGGYSTNLQLRNEQTATLNEHNQPVEKIEKHYSYSSSTATTPMSTSYTKDTYIFTATEATVTHYESNDGQAWELEGETVYPLDEYGRIDMANGKYYDAVPTAADLVLEREDITKREKDGVGNITSTLAYYIYYRYNPTEKIYSLDSYTESTYVYY